MEKKYQRTIDQIQKMVTDKVVPGVSYAIFEHDQQIKKVQGLAEITPDKKLLRPGMQYDLASLTKVIGTVPVIALLIQSGVLSLDDPVNKYLPEVGDSSATIRNLITHTADIQGYIPHRNELPAGKLLKSLLTQESFGVNLNKNILYTDIGFIYLGLIATRIWGKPIQVLSAQKIFRPLGLTRTTYVPRWQDCVPTEIEQGRGLIRGKVHDPKGYVLQRLCGSAGLFSTLDDLITFGRKLIETNLDEIFTDQTIDLLFQDQTPLRGQHNRSLGWQLLHAHTADHHTVIYHTGFTGTLIVLDRKEDQGFILLSNRVHPTSDNDEFLNRRSAIVATYMDEKD